MSISKSYNKGNDTYYVYDTQYVWSDEKQKKVRVRKCIGKIGKDGSIVPTRKKKVSAVSTETAGPSVSSETLTQYFNAFVKDIDAIKDALSSMKVNLLTFNKELSVNKKD